MQLRLVSPTSIGKVKAFFAKNSNLGKNLEGEKFGGNSKSEVLVRGMDQLITKRSSSLPAPLRVTAPIAEHARSWPPAQRTSSIATHMHTRTLLHGRIFLTTTCLRRSLLPPPIPKTISFPRLVQPTDRRW